MPENDVGLQESERVVVRRGVCHCPRCDGRLVGYADVTVHPTIHVRRGGRLTLGPVVDSKRQINRQTHDSMTLGDELYCENACGFRVPGPVLARQFRGTAERVIREALGS